MTKKQVFSILSFFTVFALLFLLASYLLRPSHEDTKPVFSGFYAENKNTLDVAFLGSSAIYRYFVSPLYYKKYGVTSYVLGTPHEELQTAPYLIREIKKTQKPSLFVIEIRQLIMDDADIKNKQVDTEKSNYYLRYVTDNLLYSANRLDLINHVVKSGNRADWYLDLLYNHASWKTPSLSALLCSFYNVKSPEQGARTIGDCVPQKKWDPSAYRNKSLKLENSTQKDLVTLLQYLKSNHIPALFISSPYVTDQQTTELENAAGGTIRSYGFRYLDCNFSYDEIGIDFSTDYYNSRHVNLLGAQKFTAFLSAYIQNYYHISPHHSAATKEAWNRAYRAWETDRLSQLAQLKKGADS